MANRIFGYFSEPGQQEPTYDPGLNVECPVCYRRLTSPMVTVSLAIEEDTRSYFYRAHKGCFEDLTEDEQSDLDGLIVDAVIASRNVN